MRVHRTAQEPVIATFTGAPTQTIQASIDNGDTWLPAATRIDEEHALVFYAAGPEFSGVLDAKSVVLPLGRTEVLLRAIDAPALPADSAGGVDIW